MKQKIFCIVLCMMVCVNWMFAQTNAPEVNVVEEPDTSAIDTPEASPTNPKHKKIATTRDNMEELKELLREFNRNALAESQLETPDYNNMYVPVRGRSKFTRRNYITQRLEISILGGSDKAEDPDDSDMSGYSDDVKAGNTDDNHSFNMGLNVGYSMVFVPGHIEGEQLK